MKPLFNYIVLDILHNNLHEEECAFRSKYISEYFLKSPSQTEIEFLFSVISYLIKVENNLLLEVCPHCLGKRYDLFSDFNELV